jgi:apolipoprotein N-acyltransferase
VALRRPSLPRAFALGLTSGLVYFSATLYWITNVMAVYGDMPRILGALINGVLVAYMALFPALFALCLRALLRAFGSRALMAAPFVWVAGELGRTYIPPGGFPWVLLGYSQATQLPVAQVASVAGVYGVSALVASVSAAAAYCLDTKSTRERLLAVVPVAAIVVAAAVWGSLRIGRAEWTTAGQPLTVGLIQANVDQSEKWSPSRAAFIFDDYLNRTRQVIGQGAELVIWPESSTPFMLEEDRAAGERVRLLARQARVPILLGSDQIEWGVENGKRVAERAFNSAFLIDATGTTAGVYRKMHLVPFGEYVPLRRWLFFAAPLVAVIGTGFAAGDRAATLPLAGHPISAAICYEVVYPALVRDFVRNGSELLTTITNDAWFGRTSAPYQHFEQASMRAIEEGRYLVRSANTGISGIVDPYGRVVARTDIFRPATVVGPVKLLTGSTVYARTGDVFAYASVAITAALMAASVRRVQ